jgi:hypothetical protein
MKNVLILGDSIRIGYDKTIKKSLEGIARVEFPEENCRFASYFLRHFHEYMRVFNGEKIDVIHFNTGLWDCIRLFGEEPHTPIEIYAYYMERVCVRIKKLAPEAKVIFASSTAVISEKMEDDFKRYNEEIEAYNKVALEIVRKHGFEVNDLYSISKLLPESVHSDAVHYYTEEGTRAFAEPTLEYISKALGIETPECKIVVHGKAAFGI